MGSINQSICFGCFARDGVTPEQAITEAAKIGYKSVEKRVNAHDIHATVLHQMGIDHKKLTYRFNGRDFRLTDVYGKVVHSLLA